MNLVKWVIDTTSGRPVPAEGLQCPHSQAECPVEDLRTELDWYHAYFDENERRIYRAMQHETAWAIKQALQGDPDMKLIDPNVGETGHNNSEYYRPGRETAPGCQQSSNKGGGYSQTALEEGS